MGEPIKKELLEVLACIKCKGSLKYNKDKTKLVCSKCKKEYEIKEGIPVLL
ncbi:MAG: Trm112 family protein [Nanoarchaeota archaeon]|nr:Trm112 family protein [Nanoarchaeota archaeon]